MPVDFDTFQLTLASAMVAGLIALLLPLVRIVRHARLSRSSVLIALVPVVNVAWLCFVAASMREPRGPSHGG